MTIRFTRRARRLGTTAAAIIGALALIPVAGCASRTTGDSVKAKRPETPAGGQVSMAYPTGLASSSALKVDKTMPAEVRKNTPFTYTTRVTNVSPMTLQDVVITDACSTNLNVTDSVPALRRTESGVFQWPLGTIAPGESRTINVTASAKEAGRIQSCTTVSYNSPLCVAANVVEPALRLVRTAPADAMACETLPLRYVATNTGTGSIASVKVQETLPAGLVTTEGKRDILFTTGPLGAGESRTFTVDARAQKTGRFEGRATASGPEGLTATTDPFTTIIRKPVLTTSIEAMPKRFFGAPVSFVLTVKNTGDAPAANTVIEHAVPPGSTVVNLSDKGRQERGKAVWSLGTIAPGDDRSVQIRLKPAATGTVQSAVIARATCADDATARAQTIVEGIAAVLLEVVDQADPVLVGEETTYLITVTNQGSKVDNGIRIVCTIPESARFVRSGGVTEGRLSGRTVTFDPLPMLRIGEKQEWYVTVSAIKPADTRFRVDMKTDSLETNVTETEATRFYQFRK